MNSLFSSRSFWVALLTLFVIVVASFMPGFALDVEHGAGLALIVATYLIGLAMSPGDQLKPILTSRKFWVSLFGFAVLLLDAFHVWPVQLDYSALAGFIVIIAAYTFMLAKDPGNGWRGLLVSRKFWAAVVGVVMIFLDAFKVVLPAGFTPEQIISITLLIGGYIASAGLEKPPVPLPDPEFPPESELQEG